MLEMLLAVSVWLLLCTILLPQFIVVLAERNNIEILTIGNQLLSEELQAAFQGGVDKYDSKVLEKGGTRYWLTREYNAESNMWEVCNSWEDKLGRKVERCGYVSE
ncbi:hypothetical protein AB3M96_02400 [Fredinandcohnia sp. 179-A 10B2 NHS]